MKAIHLFTTFVAISSALPSLTQASDAALTKQYSICMDKSGGITIEMHDCIEAEMKRQDARLNKVYKEVSTQLSNARKTQLKEAQRAWIKYRDANCAFYLDPDGGTMATIDAADCALQATVSRASELERFKN